jgi:UDP-glucose 4-epimerase
MSQNKASPGSTSGLTRGRTQLRTGARRIALCGAQTFLGKRLLEILAEDPSVTRLVAIDAQEQGARAPEPGLSSALGRVRSYTVDRAEPQSAARIAEILAAEDIDTFVHLGFLEAPSRNLAYAHDLESVGTLNILNACRERPVQKLVLGSSTLLYGARYDNPNFLTETHPLRGLTGTAFLSDKIDAERQVEAFAREQRASVSVLRFAPILGPTIDSFITRWLSLPRVPVLLGYDPLLQFTHEVDALAALKQAIESQVSGVLNVAGDGVLPLSTVVRLIGRTALPVPYFVARRLCAALWSLGLSEVPAPMLRFLRHLCVADTERQRRELAEPAMFTTREAVLAFGAALRLREARLLTEAYA